MTTPGWVKSITTSVPVSTKRLIGSSWSTSADSVRSSAFSTAAAIVAPTLPLAPSTPTRMPRAYCGAGLQRCAAAEVLEDQRRLGARDVRVGVEVLHHERTQVVGVAGSDMQDEILGAGQKVDVDHLWQLADPLDEVPDPAARLGLQADR